MSYRFSTVQQFSQCVREGVKLIRIYGKESSFSVTFNCAFRHVLIEAISKSVFLALTEARRPSFLSLQNAWLLLSSLSLLLLMMLLLLCSVVINIVYRSRVR